MTSQDWIWHRKRSRDDHDLPPVRISAGSLPLPQGIDMAFTPISLPKHSTPHVTMVSSPPFTQIAPRTPRRSRFCEVCRRIDCNLISHKHFAKEDRVRRRPYRGSEITPQTSPLGVCPPSIVSQAPPVHYPVAMDSEKYHLLRLWSETWGQRRRGPERHLFPTKWIDIVLPTALNDAILFQTLLATSASMWSVANRLGEETAERHLRVAERLCVPELTVHSNADTDTVILACLCITLVYLVRGNGFETEKYFSRIVKSVSAKGGPHYLGLAGIVADTLLHIDATQAVFFDRQPTFSMILPALDIGISPCLGSAFRSSDSLDEINVDLLSAARSLCRATDILELSVPRRTAPAMNSFGYLSTVSDYQLARCNDMLRGACDWNETLCLALLLFNHVVLHSKGAINAIVTKVEERYWKAVRATLARRGFSRLPRHLILWIIITGLTPCIYAESSYRSEAVEKMRAALVGADVSSWDDFRKKVLDAYLWVRDAQEEVFHSIWLEVDGKSGPDRIM